MKKYALYVRNHCPTCARMLAWLKAEGVEVPVYNIEDDGRPEPPVPLFIFPALFREKKLVAYGDSIKKALVNA